MKLDLTRTIVAIGSGIAPARRSVVRISGPRTLDVLAQLVSSTPASRAAHSVAQVPGTGTAANSVVEKLRRAEHACRYDVRLHFCIAEDSAVDLAAECYWWPDSRSYTGEPSAELHVIGSLPIVERLVESIVEFGATPAERGEFTLRSFLAGKIDLTQAEAVLGVIEAETDKQLQWALTNLAGNLSEPIRNLRDSLMQLVAHLEAGLDFVEEDIEFISQTALFTALSGISRQLQQIEQQLSSRGGRSRLPSVVLVGLPNSGKSTLFNRLVGFDRAIVSDIEGTTRDVVSMRTEVCGKTIELSDTAGVEELSQDSPRGLAQAALMDKLRHADLLLLCVTALTGNGPVDSEISNMRSLPLSSYDGSVIQVGTKSDLGQAEGVDAAVSAYDDFSLDTLRRLIANRLEESQQHQWSDAMHQTAVRCREGIQSAGVAVKQAMGAVENDLGEEIIALEIRAAMDQLSSIIGEIHTEDILGEIFSRFCIGK